MQRYSFDCLAGPVLSTVRPLNGIISVYVYCSVQYSVQLLTAQRRASAVRDSPVQYGQWTSLALYGFYSRARRHARRQRSPPLGEPGDIAWIAWMLA